MKKKGDLKKVIKELKKRYANLSRLCPTKPATRGLRHGTMLGIDICVDLIKQEFQIK